MPLNTRLDPETIAFMLDHGEAKAVIVDPEFSGTMAKALAAPGHHAAAHRGGAGRLYGAPAQRSMAQTTKPSWPVAMRNLPGSCPPTNGTPLP